MDRPAYQSDAALIELDTDVIEVGRDRDRDFAITADTIFYPEGGGQPCDQGSMGDVDVIDVQKVGGVVHHYLSAGLAVGPVRMELDWGRRFDHMQQHTGQHLLTAVALKHFGWATTAFHMGPAVSDIELDMASLEDRELRLLEDALAEEIRANRPVTVRYAGINEMEALGVRSRLLPEDFKGDLRLVEIEGLDLNTCGGTHLHSTAEIGALALLGTETMRGGTRVFFVAGDRVRWRLIEHEARNLRLRKLLDSADDDLPGLIELRLGREKELARERRRLMTELARAEADGLAALDEIVTSAHWDDREIPFLQEVAKALVERAPDQIALLTSGCGDEGGFLLVAGESTGLDLGVAGSEICAILDGRGGGRPPFFQGKAMNLSCRSQAVDALVRLTGG